jgi:hypothetical protein
MLTFDFVHVTYGYIKDKQKLVFNFIFDLLWIGFSVVSVAFVGFRVLQYVESMALEENSPLCIDKRLDGL